jgi:chromate reductase
MLAQAAAAFAPAGVTFSFADITGVPLFNEDHRSAHGEPPAVQALKDGISEADGVLIVSPEYNLSVPGVLKNAIDWASYGSDHPFKGKPMAVMGTSPGRFGTISMQRHLRDVLGALGASDVRCAGRAG